MKTVVALISFTLFILSSAYGQEKDAAKIEEALRMQIDSSWTVNIDTANIPKDAFDHGILIGWVRLTNNQGDEIHFSLCKPLNVQLLKKEIEHTQLIASCTLTGYDYNLFKSIIKIENCYLFLIGYPCWSTYSQNTTLLMKELVEKMQKM